MRMITLDKQALLRTMPDLARRHWNQMPQAVACLGGGSFGLVFRLDFPDGRRAVVKAYRVEGMNETEAFQLRLLGAHTRVPMPRPLFTAENYLGMTFIEGYDALTQLRFLVKSKALRQQFAADVVTGMLDWHAVEGKAFGYVQDLGCSDWRAFYQTIVDEVLAGIRAMENFSPRQRATLEAAAAQQDKILTEDVGAPRLIHGDLNVMNIMADVKTFRLTGFIDPFNSMWADREYDLFQLRNVTGDRYGLYREYKSRVRCSELVDLKITYYAAVNEALAYLRSGKKFEPNHIIWDQRLRHEMKRYGLKLP